MADILEKIKAYKLEEIAAAKLRRNESQLERDMLEVERPLGFLAALERERKESRPSLIAEIKRASPSKGLIRENFEVPALALAYQRGGATCLSVLTDGPSFQGKPEYISQAKRAAKIPILRKDFLFDPYQVLEARAWGADCILIIMAAVDDRMAKVLLDAAKYCGMDALVEVHNEEEMARANALNAPLIGVNNRDLRTFEVTLETTRRLAKMRQPGTLFVSESGIFTHDDIIDLQSHGADAFLVGESLMRADDVEAATRALMRGK